MTIPYRTRRVLKRLGIGVVTVLTLAVVAWLCWMLWLGRYVIYTRDGGARLDFGRSSLDIAGDPAPKPEPVTPVPIYYNEGENALNVSRELTQIMGYYVTAKDLEGDISAVKTKLQTLEKGTAVMVDVKNIQGGFFYSSGIHDIRAKSIDTGAMDELLDYLQLSDLYTIARLPAFRDYYYGLDHVPDGLPTAGGYLWMDDDRCYWLSPASQGTMAYLVEIVNELKALGFDEVVFTDFRFPDTNEIVFKSDKNEALAQAAQLLVKTCATDSFAVSFTGAASFPVPEGRSRLFVTGADASDASAIAENSGLENPQVRLVFLTDLHDTRFEAYSVLRPLSSAN